MKCPTQNSDMEQDNYSSQQNKQQDDELMELMWQNGQVVILNQNQLRRSPQNPVAATPHTSEPSQRPLHDGTLLTPQLYIQEDEMTSWLHYPLFDPSFDRRDLYPDCLFMPPVSLHALEMETFHRHEDIADPSSIPYLPPLLPSSLTPGSVGGNIENFSKMESSSFPHSLPSTSSKQPYGSMTAEKQSTVVDSNDTPMIPIYSGSGQMMVGSSADGSGWSFGGGIVAPPVAGEGGSRGVVFNRPQDAICDLSLTSSPAGGNACVVAPTVTKNRKPANGRKRKAITEAVTSELHTEDSEHASMGKNKQLHGSSTSRRSRAAQVHNLSERRRRDRINEKMKVLQELIPRCNKFGSQTDKASMLDEAIEYMKSLQLQVQMMSNMGCGMMPVMCPGVHQYMQTQMGMGMPLDHMNMTRPVMPFPPILSSSSLPTPQVVATRMDQKLPLPPYSRVPPPVPPSFVIRAPPKSQGDLATTQPNLPAIPSLIDPICQPNVEMPQVQVPPTIILPSRRGNENQPTLMPYNNNATTSKGNPCP